MSTNDQDRLIPLELTLDTLGWLRGYLREETFAAYRDYKAVESLHNNMAIRAAQGMLREERERMQTITTAIDELFAAHDEHESIARKIAEMTLPAA